MICLGILVDTEAFTLEVPASRLEELLTELTIWQKIFIFYQEAPSIPSWEALVCNGVCQAW